MDNYFEMYTPQVLTEALDLVEHPTHWLTRQFINPASEELLATEKVAYDIVTGKYRMAPMGYTGDPAQYVNFQRKLDTKVVAPAQIYIKEDISIEDIYKIRMAGESPVFSSDGEASSAMQRAFNEYFGNKQADMLESYANRMEWMIGQIIKNPGTISYTNPETGRVFSIDYGVPEGNDFTAGDLWDDADTDIPIDLKTWQKTYTKLNGYAATHILCGDDAADAFLRHSSVRNFFGYRNGTPPRMVDMDMLKKEDDVYHVGYVQGVGDLWNYTNEFVDDQDDTTKSYLDDKYIYLFNPKSIKTYYGAILDFGFPGYIKRAKQYSKITTSTDGKHKEIILESHPLIVLRRNTGIMRIKVLS